MVKIKQKNNFQWTEATIRQQLEEINDLKSLTSLNPNNEKRKKDFYPN